MRIHKKVLSMDSGQWILCAWDECDRQGYELYKVRVREGQTIIQYVFCSERHKQYWIESSRSLSGRLPSGARSMLAPR